MSKRTKWLLSIGVIAALVIGWQVAALAVHNETFQLEGDAIDNAANPPDDWENVFNHTSSATDTAFVAEPNPQDSFFTGGGSKDPNAISQWQWKNDTGGIPDKTNLSDSFAASYTLGTAPNQRKLLYFGADRFDGSGDAAIAFWFFQNPVTRVGTGSGTFSGTHANNDVLVISNFSNGGVVPTITVYKWDTSCTKASGPNPGAGDCGAANLKIVATSNNADCAGPANPDTACAIVNKAQNAPNTSPWPFTDKDGNHNFAPGEFMEGGIDLTALGLGNTCFSTALAETRTSTSPTSTLKDFTIGSFGQCNSGLTTTPKDNAGNTIGTGANGISIGTGSAQVKDSATITVSGTTTWTGNLKFFLCAPNQLDANNLCSTGGTQIGPAAGTTITNATTQPILSDAATVTSAGRYCWRGVFTSGTTGVPNSTDASAGECFTVNPVTPNLATTAGPDAALGSPISDTATLTGAANKPGTPVINPTTQGGPAGGTITFKLYGPGNCTEPPVFTSTAQPVSANGTAGPVSFTPTQPGTYHWVATYSGDSPNTLGTSHNTDCTDANEDVVVGNSGVTTTPKDNAGNDIPDGGLDIGTGPTDSGTVKVKDSATVNVAGQTTWEGNMTFFLCKVDAPATCDTGGTAIGGNVPVSNTTPTVTSDAATVTSAGRYCWRGVFTATTAGVPNSTDSSAGECFTVNPVTPTLDTEAVASPVDFGQPVQDNATLTGTANQPDDPVINTTGAAGDPAGGTITFTLYKDDCQTLATGTGDNPQTVNVNGNDTYGPVSFTPDEPGTYHWVAEYSGDPPNTNETDHNVDCSDSNEQVVVDQRPSTVDTVQSFIPNDEATVSSGPDGTPLGSGTVTFKLYDSLDHCQGNTDTGLLYEEGPVDISGISPQTVSTTNDGTPSAPGATDGYTVNAVGDTTLFWNVSYSGNGGSVAGSSSECVEDSTLTIDNETEPPTP